MSSYMVVKSSVDKCVWFRNPRVGSRSILTLLDRHLEVDVGDDVEWSKGQFDEKLISYGVGYDDAWDDYFKMAFVRDPWDRLISFYGGKIMRVLNSQKILNKNDVRVDSARDMLDISDGDRKVREVFEDYRSFEYFIKSLRAEDLSTCDVHYRKQVTMFPHDKLDFIGRYEHFNADVEKIMRILGIPSYNLQRIGRSPWSPYTEKYNDELAGIVYDLYKDDIDAFGYKFGDGLIT